MSEHNRDAFDDLVARLAAVPADNEVRQLRRWAEGYKPYEAAVELLVTTPLRHDLLPVLTSRDDLITWVDTIGGLARVKRARLPEDAHRVALLVLELAEVSTGEPLSDLLGGVDDLTVAAFLNAVAMSAGWGERSVTSTVTGTGYDGAGVR